MGSRHRSLTLCLGFVLVACGGNTPASEDGGSGDGVDGGDVLADGGVPTIDDLEALTACDGPFNPGQVLTFRITTGEDFPGLEDDDYGAGTFACGDEEPIRVGVRARAGSEGWLVDINWAVAGQSWRTLKKLGFHTGYGGDVTTEYLAWRAQRIGVGTMVERSALARLFVNGQDQGILFNLEKVDQRFLRSRLGDDSGWLFKKSGDDDAYQTNEGQPNPYEDDFCFFQESQPCAPPADLETWLPEHLAIDQLLRFGGVNMIIGNSDGPLTKPHNHYIYDYDGGPRYYFPWDLDSSWTQSIEAFSGPGGSVFQDVLFPLWEDEYDAIVTELLGGPMSVASVHAEIDQAIAVGKGEVNEGMASGFKDWYADRHADVSAQVAAH